MKITHDNSNLVVIKRIDNNPISEEAAAVVVKSLSLSSTSLRCGALLGKMIDASRFHERVIGGLFSVRWLGAPSSSMAEAESDDPPEGGAEDATKM